MNQRNNILNFLKKHSVLQGEEYTLASGQKSNVYIDLKKSMLSAYCGSLLANLFYDRVKFWHPSAVAGYGLGGYHLASIVSHFSYNDADDTIDFDTIYIRKEIKSHGTQQLIEAPSTLTSKSVVMVEDVVSTGKSVLEGAKILEEGGYSVKGIVAAVDRRSDRSVPTLGDYGFVSLFDIDELTE